MDFQLESEAGIATELGAGRTRAYPIDTSRQINTFRQEYLHSGEPIPVSFRSIVPWLKIGERATHYLHSYPAKLLPHIAHFFLASAEMCPSGGVVLDPFAGSGTVALETRLSGRVGAYADTNPLARLVTETKHCTFSPEVLTAGMQRLRRRFAKSRSTQHPAVVNIEKWFQPIVIRTLSRLNSAIAGERNFELRKLFLSTFSATVRRVSNADPRLSVPVLQRDELKPWTAGEVWKKFSDQFESNARRIAELQELSPKGHKLVLAGRDARAIHVASGGNLESNSVDLVITSPPYAGAQKYIRATSLSLGWLGMAPDGKLKPLENLTIGREHLPGIGQALPLTSVQAANVVLEEIYQINPLRAAICAVYLNEMEEVISQLRLVVRPGGRFVLVIGNNAVCGKDFMSSEYLRELIERAGFKLEFALIDEIKSRGLMTKRNKTASVITREWVMVFEKIC